MPARTRILTEGCDYFLSCLMFYIISLKNIILEEIRFIEVIYLVLKSVSVFMSSFTLVEQRKRPELKGLPTAVVQYNSWKGGGLIAVSYEARKFGVQR